MEKERFQRNTKDMLQERVFDVCFLIAFQLIDDDTHTTFIVG